MAITCPKCGHQYDVTLFSYDKEIRCACGAQFGITQGHWLNLPTPVEGVLIDIGGVLHVGNKPIDGAVEAIKHLQQSGLQIRFLTNTSQITRQQLWSRLRNLGFHIDVDALFTAPVATRQYLEHHQYRPYLLIHPHMQSEFSGLDCTSPNAVVVGDAGELFQYRSLNEAFRIVMAGGVLISMGSNRYFQEADGLSLDMGPFVEALRFATGVEPTVIGKPSKDFFQHALDDMGVVATRAVMIGDDLENDIGGAQALGIRGYLVRTGKFRPQDEADTRIKPECVVDDLAVAAKQITEEFLL